MKPRLSVLTICVDCLVLAGVLIAQAGLESLPVVTADPVFAAYRVPVIWEG